MSDIEELRAVAQQALHLLTQHLLSINSLAPELRSGITLRQIRGPESFEDTWHMTFDVLMPNSDKSVEFTLCQTGSGGYLIEDEEA